jgi:hypothetical protein
MNTSVNTADLYNFSDTAGVPDDVVASLNKERVSGLNEALYAAVVAAVSGAPKALTMKQVIFVLYKMGAMESEPADTTIRGYLNRARDNGDIGKPSRQSYWTAESDVADAEAEAAESTEEDDVNTDDVNTDDEDALAGLGIE